MMAKNKTDIWLPIYVGDYLADTMHLTTEQHGAYFLLIMAYWKNRGALPENRIQGIVNINGNSWSIAEALLKEYFDTTTHPGKWYHKRIEEELKKALIRKQAAENRGKKGSDVRWKDKTTDSSTNGSTIVEGIVGDSTSPSPSPSLKDICMGNDVVQEKTKKEKRINSITPSVDEIKLYCLERNNNIDPEYFIDYQKARNWKLKGGQKITDWKAVIRTWEHNNFNITSKTKPEYPQKPIEEQLS